MNPRSECFPEIKLQLINFDKNTSSLLELKALLSSFFIGNGGVNVRLRSEDEDAHGPLDF